MNKRMDRLGGCVKNRGPGNFKLMSTEPLLRLALMKIPSESCVMPKVPTGCMQVLTCVRARTDIRPCD